MRIEHGGRTIAESTRALRILETSHPPAIYVPPADVERELLTPSGGGSTTADIKGLSLYFRG